jgi:tartrate dehydrogenase/decarboxylase/D-malate dehydrogenase
MPPGSASDSNSPGISSTGAAKRTSKRDKMMPADGLDQLRPFDAIFLGAGGSPGVPDHISLWGLLIPIRRGFRQYINLRPVRLFEGIETPLKGWKPGQIDFVIVRETMKANTPTSAGASTEAPKMRWSSRKRFYRAWS